MARLLILGGTTEARQLAERLAGLPDLAVTVSLAGRTTNIVAHPVPLRVGGFGGAGGLAAYLRTEKIDALIDVTHPYADTIKENALAAARAAGVPFLALRRPAWQPAAGDHWREVTDAGAAVAALGEAPRRAFLALGRQELAPFAAAPQHFYLIRSIEPIDPPLPVRRTVYVTGRGPFSEAADRALLREHQIDVLVCRNSGGAAAYGKIAAARALSLEVVMIRRALPPDAPAVATVDAAVAWIDHRFPPPAARGV